MTLITSDSVACRIQTRPLDELYAALGKKKQLAKLLSSKGTAVDPRHRGAKVYRGGTA